MTEQGQGHKILIADDESEVVDLVRMVLEMEGYEIVSAADGTQALATIKAHAPDLVLLDVRMPKMTGYEACAKLKKDPNTNDIPIVFLSAKGQDTEIKRGIELGAAEYILKPFAPDELFERVAGILKQSGYQVMSA